MENLPNKVWKIKGTAVGPTFVVMGSIHGNERIGAEVVEELAKLPFGSGTLYLIVGSPEAYDANARFIEEDINRLFGSEFDSITGATLEQKRALEIAPILKEADYFLDLHSTIKPSVPFVFCEPDEQHVELASKFGAKYVVSAATDFRPPDLASSTDNFVDRNGGIGFTYEAGCHSDPQKLDEVLDIAKKFISQDLKSDVKPEHLIIHSDLVASSDNFSFVKDFGNFDMVSSGETIAHDGGKEIKIESDSFIIFPKLNIKEGEVACYLAHKAIS